VVMRDPGREVEENEGENERRERIEGGGKEGWVEIEGGRSMNVHRAHFCLLVSSQALETHYSA
jgi:hypothetical protein